MNIVILLIEIKLILLLKTYFIANLKILWLIFIIKKVKKYLKIT